MSQPWGIIWAPDRGKTRRRADSCCDRESFREKEGRPLMGTVRRKKKKRRPASGAMALPGKKGRGPGEEMKSGVMEKGKLWWKKSDFSK